MNQMLIVVVLVALAGVYLLHSFRRMLAGRSDCASHCTKCPAATDCEDRPAEPRPLDA